ncbi:MAG TPA: NADH oxidase, partial [Caldimonas sp.]|nr:NADH oxidase [Caldimonas sp.]
GQMLNRVCIADGIGLVNVVRRDEHIALLRGEGARHVVSTSSPAFAGELTEAIAATGATLAFDAIGGGRLAGQILAAMEAALARSATEYSRYGTSTLKQVYLYGSLDTSPTEIVRSFGMAWAVGGWLVFPFLQRIGADAANALRARVARELKTTFASRYTRTVSLARALQPDSIAEYGRRATATKVLIDPSA